MDDPTEPDPIDEPNDPNEPGYPGEPPPFEPPIVSDPPTKYQVRGVSVTILNERVQYYDKDGKLITESIKGLQ